MMGTKGKIYNDTDATLMDAQRLSELPLPKSLGPRHKPLAYIDVATTLVDAVGRAGIELIDAPQWAVGKFRNVQAHDGSMVRVDNAELVGLLNVRGGGLPELSDGAWQIAIQGGVAEHLAWSLMVGEKLFVCTNLSLLGGALVLKKKSTTGLFDLPGLFDEALVRYRLECKRVVGAKAELEMRRCDNTGAYEMAAKAVMESAIPARNLKPILCSWHAGAKHPTDMADCAARTQLGLYNCFTRSIRDQPLMQQTASSTKIGRYFGITA
jgi:hypothetical protein